MLFAFIVILGRFTYQKVKKKTIHMSLYIALSVLIATVISLSTATFFSHQEQYQQFGLQNNPMYYWEVYGWPFEFYREHDYWPEKTLSIERKIHLGKLFLNILLFTFIIATPQIITKKIITIRPS